MENAIYAKTIADLRQLSEAQLIELHDSLISEDAGRTVIRTAYYLDELQRRESAKREDQMIYLTKVILGLTVLNAVFVAVSVF